MVCRVCKDGKSKRERGKRDFLRERAVCCFSSSTAPLTQPHLVRSSFSFSPSFFILVSKILKGENDSLVEKEENLLGKKVHSFTQSSSLFSNLYLVKKKERGREKKQEE